MDHTPASLLDQLKRPGTNAQAWKQFVLLVTPLLYGWARRLGLQDSDAADLLQDVFTVLYERLPSFAYDKNRSFRAWLRTILTNRWRTLQRRHSPVSFSAQPTLTEDLASADAVAELTEAEYQRALARRALELMQSDFQGTTWQACWATVVEDRQPAEVATALGVSVKAVYQARARVLARLRLELQGLLE